MSDTDRETLEVDVLFVGGGPSSLAGAIRLAQKAQAAGIEMPQIAVIEKGAEIGNHQMSGALIQPGPLQELLPDFLAKGCPVESEVTSEAVHFLTRSRSLKFPILPPQMHNHGNYVVSLAKVTRWLGEQAAALGINLFTGFAGTEVLYEGDRVAGVRTGDKGIDAKGQRKGNFEPGVDLRATCTVFGEGVRGYLTKQLVPRLKLGERKNSPTFETGVKEVWECPAGRIKPGMVIHTMGYPLSPDTAGGSFLYGMKDNLLVVGIVVSLDYEDPFLEPYAELQKLKQHPLVAKLIEGGKPVAYGAKAIASGGYHSIPRLYFNGGMIIGESGQLLDMSRLKGVHVGMRSGMIAADVIFENLKEKRDFSASNLKPYQERLMVSDVGRDLHGARNFHWALTRGMPWSFIHLGLQQITAGRGLIDGARTKRDLLHYETVERRYGRKDVPLPQMKDRLNYVEKLTAVFNAGTLHEENQPAHLKIHDTNRCYKECIEEYRFPCNRFCPAGVYEMLNEAGTWRFQINFTNCVHCQTCDIKCPKDNILWTPPEGGGGPRYAIL
ncbi:MAG: electron transfer flavoprotein-ubiquinone oxidoreductase [Pseudomonadota bacterium]